VDVLRTPPTTAVRVRYTQDFTGTWQLNAAKSKLDNTVGQTMKIENVGPDTYKTTIDAVLKSGEKRHQEISRTYDGKERPSVGIGAPSGATEICQHVNASTRKVTQKRDGKLFSEFTSTISPDGKVMTNRRITGNTEEILVFEKQ
jgi:hypothetical protein